MASSRWTDIELRVASGRWTDTELRVASGRWTLSLTPFLQAVIHKSAGYPTPSGCISKNQRRLSKCPELSCMSSTFLSVKSSLGVGAQTYSLTRRHCPMSNKGNCGYANTAGRSHTYYFHIFKAHLQWAIKVQGNQPPVFLTVGSLRDCLFRKTCKLLSVLWSLLAS